MQGRNRLNRRECIPRNLSRWQWDHCRSSIPRSSISFAPDRESPCPDSTTTNRSRLSVTSIGDGSYSQKSL